jgi:hypothetical protein
MLRKCLVLLVVMAIAVPVFAGEKSTQQQLSAISALIDQADEMVVYGEGFKREFVVYRSRNRKDFNELKAAITLKRAGGPFQCACMDGPEIALMKDGKEIATVWNHEGTAIGSSVWDGDWETADSNRWLRWFDAREMKFAREFYNQMQSQARSDETAERRWNKATPSSLRPLTKVMNFTDLTEGTLKLKPFNDALKNQYPDERNRILALMAWYGSGAGPWSGYPGYEQLVEKLLRQYPTTLLITVAESDKLDDQQLEGAARILAGWTPVRDQTQIPDSLRKKLLEHSLKSNDQDKIERAKKRFGDDN